MQTPPRTAGEVFEQDSLTDQLSDESLEQVVKRFMSTGYVPRSTEKPDFELTSATTGAEVEAAFDDLRTEDVSRLDKVDRLDVLVTAQRLAEQEQRKAKSERPNQEPRRPQGAPEEKTLPPIVEGVQKQD